MVREKHVPAKLLPACFVEALSPGVGREASAPVLQGCDREVHDCFGASRCGKLAKLLGRQFLEVPRSCPELANESQHQLTRRLVGQQDETEIQQIIESEAQTLLSPSTGRDIANPKDDPRQSGVTEVELANGGVYILDGRVDLDTVMGLDLVDRQELIDERGGCLQGATIRCAYGPAAQLSFRLQPLDMKGSSSRCIVAAGNYEQIAELQFNNVDLA